VSECPIAQAWMLANDPGAEFHRAEAEVFTSQIALDVVILDEVLYYFTKPINMVERLMSRLKPGGGCIVSIVRKASHNRVWRDLHRVVCIEDTVQLTNQDGVTWDIKVIRRPENLGGPVQGSANRAFSANGTSEEVT
jgi:2-polyprenyl-3-methyl-5-hydroxy-6-metoxy-1,4-benzoquinol methylase